MPLPPRHPHPLREIRSVLGKTQTEFAQLVGTSAITVKRVENGSLVLSDKLAARICAATGASRFELQKGHDGKAIGYDDQPYTTDTFKRWTSGWHAPTPEKAGRHAKELGEFVELLCLSAADSKRKSLKGVYAALSIAIDGVCREYGLDAGVTKLWERDAVKKKSLPKGKGSYTVVNGGIRHLLEPAYHRQGKLAPGLSFYNIFATSRQN